MWAMDNTELIPYIVDVKNKILPVFSLTFITFMEWDQRGWDLF